MAKEASVVGNLTITRRLDDGTMRSFNNLLPGAFTATVVGRKGPSPGTVHISVTGTDINLSELDDPSLCAMYNPGDYPIDVGIYDPQRGRFYPMIRLLAGEGYPMRFSPYLLGELGPGTGGTGTIGADTNTLRAISQGGVGLLFVGAFDQ